MESKGHQVDYFFATWNTTRDYWYPQSFSLKTQRPVTPAEVEQIFLSTGRNLAGYQLLTQIPEYPTSNYYQSYLAKIANILKRRYEFTNNFIYDQVFEIRPDLLIVDKNKVIEKISNFECLIDIQYEHDIHFPQAMDFYLQNNSFGNDVMSDRFYYQKSLEVATKFEYNHWEAVMHNHWILVDYLYARRMQHRVRTGNVFQIVIRTNFPPGDLTEYPEFELEGLCNEYLEQIRGQQ